ncbi:hypothetical protein CYMTET_49571 [Cymbomonas tetramitiformis]|uniref:CoA transferase n=1 Tax=Cymbomonas tetramitiformis TaxID=36881 RepID=A0AAE0BPW2_9CHLO|nr:hypothetical protein CYMTET_49571 [Cymbomonas tetramitiformis]
MSRILAGPFCTQILADLGAQIIKIERPGVGDDTRYFAPPYLRNPDGSDSKESAYFNAINRNKRSITLDYTKPQGEKILLKLMERSDVLVENFKPGTLQKYGFGYESLKERFPGLVYCSMSGFGHTGPFSHKPAYDAMIQGMSGIMSLTGEPKGDPMKVGISISDTTTGLFGALAVLAALQHKNATGRGQHCDVAMLDTSLYMLANQGASFLATRENPKRYGNNHPSIVPYQVVPSSDGFFTLAIANDKAFANFCKVAQREDLLEDARFATAPERVKFREVVVPLVTEITRSKTSCWWQEHLEAVGVGVAPVSTLEDVFNNEQVKAREMVIQMEHPAIGGPVDYVAHPVKYSESVASYRTPPPLLGEHTAEVLSEMGFCDSQIEALGKEKVI